MPVAEPEAGDPGSLRRRAAPPAPPAERHQTSHKAAPARPGLWSTRRSDGGSGPGLPASSRLAGCHFRTASAGQDRARTRRTRPSFEPGTRGDRLVQWDSDSERHPQLERPTVSHARTRTHTHARARTIRTPDFFFSASSFLETSTGALSSSLNIKYYRIRVCRATRTEMQGVAPGNYRAMISTSISIFSGAVWSAIIGSVSVTVCSIQCGR